jgi:hypothetical protein
MLFDGRDFHRLPSMTDAALQGRPALVRRGLWLNYVAIAYNTLEAIVSIGAGTVAGSAASRPVPNFHSARTCR